MRNQFACVSCTVGSCALETLKKHELEAMESRTCQANFQRGEIIRKQQTPVNDLIYLRSGYVKEFVKHESTADQVIQIINPKSYIGLMGICINTDSLYSYQAITDVELCFIDKDTFGNLITHNGNFAREILVTLSEESINNHHRFLSLNKTQLFGKVASLLLYLSEQVYKQGHYDLFLSRTELSQMIASTRESVTRALQWFHREGIIELNKNSIYIKDLKRLSDISKKG